MAEQKQFTRALPQKLTAKQQRALEVLLVGGSDQQAADAAGVTRPTVVIWRGSVPPFSAALTAARSDLLKRTSARLHAATTVAVRALEEIAKDSRFPSARVSAARAILEMSNKLVLTEDLERRVDELERDLEADRQAQNNER